MTIITFNIQDITYSLSSVVCSVRHQVLSCDKMPYTTRARPHSNRSCTLASVFSKINIISYSVWIIHYIIFLPQSEIWLIDGSTPRNIQIKLWGLRQFKQISTPIRYDGQSSVVVVLPRYRVVSSDQWAI